MYDDEILNFINGNVLRLSTAGDAGRSKLRKRALEMFSDANGSYLFGVSRVGIANLGIDIDNTYLYVFFSGGFISVVFYILFIIKDVIVVFKQRSDYTLRFVSIGVLGSYFVFALYESIALYELGILNFLFMLFISILPRAIDSKSYKYSNNWRIIKND